MKNIKGIRIDNINSIIVMNYKFAAAAEKFGTPEYNLLRDIKADNPYMRTEVRAGRKRTTCNASKRLTYENMKTYIRVQKNSKELLAAFENAVQESKPQPSPYAFVRDWFVKQFPDYKKCKVFVESPAVQAPDFTPKNTEKQAA